MKKTVLALSLILFLSFVFINDVKADKPESCLYKFKVGNTGAECSFNFYNNSDLDLDFTCTGENVSKFEINDYKVNYKEKNYYIQPDHNLITLMNNYRFGDFSVLNGEQCKQLYWDAYIDGTANNSLYISLSTTATDNQFLYDSSQKTLKKAEIPDTLFAEDKDLNITCDYKYKYDIENLKNLNGNVKAKIDYETGYLTFDDGEQIELENRNCPNYIVQNCTSQICYYSAYDVLPENPNFTYIFSQKKISTLKKSCGQYEMYEYTYTSDNCKREKSKTTKKFSFYLKKESSYIRYYLQTEDKVYDIGTGNGDSTICPDKLYFGWLSRRNFSGNYITVDKNSFSFSKLEGYILKANGIDTEPSSENNSKCDNNSSGDNPNSKPSEKPTYNPYDDIVECTDFNNNIKACACMPAAVADITSFIYKFLQIGGPVLLIILGGIDLGKAIVATDESGIQKAKKKLVNKFVAAACIFLVFSVIQMIANITGGSKYANNGEETCLYILLNGYRGI